LHMQLDRYLFIPGKARQQSPTYSATDTVCHVRSPSVVSDGTPHGDKPHATGSCRASKVSQGSSGAQCHEYTSEVPGPSSAGKTRPGNSLHRFQVTPASHPPYPVCDGISTASSLSNHPIPPPSRQTIPSRIPPFLSSPLLTSFYAL
jgi:hypothetical protein